MAEPRLQTAPLDLATAFHARKAADPTARSRDIADALGVTEGVLVEARRGDDVHRLAPRGVDFVGLLEALKDAGPVMSLTRNDAAVHETTGQMDTVASHNTMGQVLGGIDLRLFLRHWHVGYAVREETRSGRRSSIQVFDATGMPVIKLYAVASTDMALWQRIVEDNLDSASEPTTFAPSAAPEPERPDSEIDVVALREGWLALDHSHDFHRLLRETGAGREQALRLAGEDLAFCTTAEIVERMLTGAAKSGVSLMCFVGNPGCLQIFSGPVEQVATLGPWLNVLDPGFNLHLRTDKIASTWVVIKPTRLRGRITSVELFDAQHQLICQFFGSRPPGEPERDAWRGLLEQSLGAAA